MLVIRLQSLDITLNLLNQFPCPLMYLFDMHILFNFNMLTNQCTYNFAVLLHSIMWLNEITHCQALHMFEIKRD